MGAPAPFNLIGVAGLLIGGWPIFKEAFENLRAKRMTMELSMSIAILAAAAISEFFTALVITLFVLVAEVLEGMTVSRGRRAIRDLLDFLPPADRRGGRRVYGEDVLDRLALIGVAKVGGFRWRRSRPSCAAGAR